MAVNKNALIRYKTIDKCLQNRFKKWTLEDLIESCSEALYEYEGIDKGVSRRTVQADIQMMRSNKLGYNAPIIVTEKKYYTYENAEYSITNIPLSDQDLSMLGEAVEFMKQFQGFSHFRELDSMVQKLEGHIYAQKMDSQPVIDFEKNENLKGLKYLDTLYKSVIEKTTLILTYKSFKARQAADFIFHPYLLKEFRNRWFIVGKREKTKGIVNLALDRIEKIKQAKVGFEITTDFNAHTYFENVIGVSVSSTLTPQKIMLFVTHLHAPYVITKPLHHSQEVVERNSFGIIIQLFVQHNFELEKEILAFGNGMKVISPATLKRNIKSRIEEALEKYNTELNEKALEKHKKQVDKTGISIINQIYSPKTIRKINGWLDKETDLNPTEYIYTISHESSQFNNLLLDQNINRLLTILAPGLTLKRIQYLRFTAQSKAKANDWTQNFEQKNQRHIYIALDEINDKKTTLQTYKGSHKKKMNQNDIELISQNSFSSNCEVIKGGIILLNPRLLHSFTKATQQQRSRFLVMEFR